MSIFSSLTVGISGLQAQGNKLGAISDNIANLNTFGYKRNEANFQTLVAGGVASIRRQLNGAQGEIVTTNSPTDIALAGAGFFAISSQTTGGDVFYTRAGSFTGDADGNFRNGAGYYLQGWQLDETGELPDAVAGTSVSADAAIAALTTVNILQLTADPVATANVAILANLNSGQVAWAGTPVYDATSNTANMASGSIAPHFNRALNIIDSAGVAHTCNIDFLKTDINTWAVEIVIDPPTDVVGGNGQIAAGTVTFNGNGTLASVSTSLSSAVAVSWQNSDPENVAGPSSITFDWGTAGPISGPAGTVLGDTDGLSQFDSQHHVRSIRQDGVQVGQLSRIEISENGFVTAFYSDGSSRHFYKVPVATFPESDRLNAISGNIYAPTSESGTPTFQQSAQNGAGEILAGSLESSNVDVASQLTDMIIAQRAYQSNAKIITTSDDMLKTLDEILR